MEMGDGRAQDVPGVVHSQLGIGSNVGNVSIVEGDGMLKRLANHS